MSTIVMFTQAVAARENEIKTNEARDLYRPAAERAALLYFTIKELHNINPMYQYSLKVTHCTGKCVAVALSNYYTASTLPFKRLALLRFFIQYLLLF